MGSAATDRWLLPVVGVFTTVATATFLIARPVSLPGWLPGAPPAQPNVVEAEAGPGLGVPQTFLVAAGDREITVTWPSADGADRYRVDAVNEVDTPEPSPCRPSRTRTSAGSGCVVSDLRNGVPYLLTVRPADDTDTSVPPRLVRAVPRPAILASPNAVVWLDVADYATIKPQHSGPARVGSRVAELRDKSPRHLDAVQPDDAREPALGQMGRLPALLFDGNDILRLDGRSLPSGDRPSTVLVVAAQDDQSGATSCFRNLLAWGSRQLGQARILHKGCQTSLAFAETYDTSDGQRPTQAWPIGRAAVMSAVFDKAGISVRLNGTPSYRWDAPVSQRMNTVAAPDAHVGGASWGMDSDSWIGRIGEVVVFDRLLTPPELTAMEEYLAAKWQLPVDPR
jgi:hypothetical protein